MKKLIVLVALVLLSAPAYAAIVGTSHDFTSATWGNGDICSPCHTPHNADTSIADAPLWDHDVTTATFTLYSSSTLDATMTQPTSGISALCLGCHDGTVALDSFGGASGSTNLTGNALLGTDISDDHPVAFTYDSTLAGNDGELVDPSADGDTDANTVGAATPYAQLFSGSLECASCHDPHGQTSVPSLLFMSNAGSALCLKCHTK